MSSSPMEIDESSSPEKTTAKGKTLILEDPPSGQVKATPWVEKYRPQSLADVAAHRDIVDTIDRLTNENKLPHLLLYGPPGTGKTSTILAVARKLYGTHYHNMILELNASDDRGIDVVRQQIQDFASTQSFSFGAKSLVKLVLLDEADAMTKDAQFALRRVIEKYTKSTRFALICNHVNKIIPALQSRCTRFRFAPLNATHVKERLQHVIKAEGFMTPKDVMDMAWTRHGLGMDTDLHIKNEVSAMIQHNRLPHFEADKILKTLQNIKGKLHGDHLVDLTKFWNRRAILWLDVSDSGLEAFVRLSNGDMRKALNILQSTHMASQTITEEAVYLCTGNPMPKDIEQICFWLLNEPFAASFRYISEIKMKKGLALVDIVREVTMFIFNIKMPSDARVQLINDLADIEYRLSFGCNDKLQLGALVTGFSHARCSMVAAAK